MGICGSHSEISDVYVGRCRPSYDVVIKGVYLEFAGSSVNIKC